MAVNKESSSVLPRLHFVLRVLGLGAAVAGLGYVVANDPLSWQAFKALFRSPEQAWPLYVCVGVAGLALAVELVSALGFAAARRSITGTFAAFQVTLAALLLVGVNWWAFESPHRFDWTRHGEFTLPDDLRQQLAQLNPQSETKVIVYQRHKTFGALTDKPDRYDYAAERKVVEKVRDLVELLRTVGPQLSVEVLDVEEEGFEDKLARVTEGNPALKKAIDDATENSLFISGAGHVQQMSFNEFYQLDRRASRQGRGNLVLLGQGEDGGGIRPFVRRILELQQRRPRVGILVVHELLTTGGSNDILSLAGLRKTLEANGFDTQDVVLKKWQPPMPTPDVLSLDEGRLAQTQSRLRYLDRLEPGLAQALKLREALLADLRKPGSEAAAQMKQIAARHAPLLRTIIIGGDLDASLREDLLEMLPAEMASLRDRQEKAAAQRKELEQKLKGFDLDALNELKHLADLRAKLTYSLAGCDMLLIPRLTRMSESGELINPRFHYLSVEQASVVREALKAGKPLLACLGPANEMPRDLGARPDPLPPGPDDVETDLEALGFRLGRGTVLFDGDTRAFLEGEEGPFSRPEPAEVPPLDFSTPTAKADPRTGKGSTNENRLRRGLRVLANSVDGFGLKLRFPRPVYFERDGRTEGTFLMTAPDGWIESKPFPNLRARYVPEYTQPRPDDPGKGTLEARRRGPVSVAAAAETSIPDSWVGDKGAAGTVRVAVIGQGEIFVGAKLDPPRERLLLQTANWLLGRDDYLPSADHPWSYPRRPELPEQPTYRLWLWGGQVGLPLLAAFFGVVVLLYRRLR